MNANVDVRVGVVPWEGLSSMGRARPCIICGPDQARNRELSPLFAFLGVAYTRRGTIDTWALAGLAQHG